jgi:alkylation response protein AidB-like acyl-CoA dehydrogenase
MEHFLTDVQKEIVKLSREIAEREIVPVRARLDREEIFPRDILQTAASAGLTGVFIPEQYGGLGGGMMELCLVTEELSRACLGVSTSYGAIALGAFPVLLGGDDALKARVLPRIATGEWLAAFCLTEPDAGSDAFAMHSTRSPCTPGRCATATTTSSPGSSSGSPTAAKPTCTR